MLSRRDGRRRLLAMVSCLTNVEGRSFVEVNEFDSRRTRPVADCWRKISLDECSSAMRRIVDDSFQLLMNRLSIEKEIGRMIRKRL